MHDDDDMPPLPRDAAEASWSEVVPLKSTKFHLLRSALLAPGLATVLVSLALFTPLQVSTYISVLAAYLIFMIFSGIHIYARSDRPYWVYVAPALIILLILATPIFSLIHSLFGFVSNDKTLAGWIAGTGLPEELAKAIPALAAAAFTLSVGRNLSSLKPAWARALTIRGPLDALLVGTASGAAFTYLETVEQYVPEAFNETFAKTHDAGVAVAGMFFLLIPRILHLFAGHGAWAGISGYFIGLAVSRRKYWPFLLALGWLVPSLLHALWDWAAPPEGGVSAIQSAVAIGSFLLFLGCVMKSRQLAARETEDEARMSIAVDAPPSPPAKGPSPAASVARTTPAPQP